MNIAIVANTTWYLSNFRSNLIRRLLADGHRVVALGAFDGYEVTLRALGIEVHPVPFDGGGLHPGRQLQAVADLRAALQRSGSQLVLSYTPKGNLYAALALATLPGVLQVANVSGLGRAFVEKTWLTQVVKPLYRFAFQRAAWVFFQNQDDLQAFLAMKLVPAEKAERIPGSGVDLERFRPSGQPTTFEETGQQPTFLMVARLIWDKGVGQFVDVARQVRRTWPDARFQLLGALAAPGPAAVLREDLAVWAREGVVEYLGTSDDIRPHLAAADCVVLPSYYREGVPRSLLEAAAMAKSVITTDAIGCRDAVDDGVTGLLCTPRDVNSLKEALLRWLDLPQAERRMMGTAARAKMILEFDEQRVIERYCAVIAQVQA
jgi:glycosyltransferase involved in cell wall biosynthesis